MRQPHLRLCLLVSRLLLSIVALVLAIMPFSERMLTFDHFLRGGQDFELSLLATLAALCLILLLAHLCRESIAQSLARLLHLRFVSGQPPLARLLHLAGVGPLPASGAPPPCFRLPLQI